MSENMMVGYKIISDGYGLCIYDSVCIKFS